MSHWAKFSELIAQIDEMEDPKGALGDFVNAHRFMLPDHDPLPALHCPHPTFMPFDSIAILIPPSNALECRLWRIHWLKKQASGRVMAFTWLRGVDQGDRWFPAKDSVTYGPDWSILMGDENNLVPVTELTVLQTMLARRKVVAVDVPVPDALAFSRQRRGKLPLVSYKVLMVDGKVWDGSYKPSRKGVGYRSHARRSFQNKWGTVVRATWVRGSRDGTVLTTYDVRPDGQGPRA